MGLKVSISALAMATTLSLTACVGDNPAYSELSRDQLAADELPPPFLQTVIGSSAPKLVEESSRLVGTRDDFDYYLVLSARLMVQRTHRPSGFRDLKHSHNRAGVCVVVVSKTSNDVWGMGCGEGGPIELSAGSNHTRYVPPDLGNNDGPDVPSGWVKLSDNLFVSE